MRTKVTLIMLFFLLLRTSYAYSQERSTEISVDFRVNSTQIDSSYKENAARISELVSFLYQVQADTAINIVKISFCGAASPEGSYELNKMLARKRMESLEKLIRSKVEIPDSIVTYNDSYIPWEYLSSMVEASGMSHKDEVLKIINEEARIVNYIGNKSIDNRVIRLKALDGGRIWKELNSRFFSPMRNACVVFVTLKNTSPSPAVIPETVAGEADTAVYVEPSPMIADTAPEPALAVEDFGRRLYVKTNVPALGFAVANVAVETDLCKHWSFNLPVYYSAWNYFKSTRKFRTFAVQPEIRYWFSEKNICNDGWFVGAHFGLAWYNIATDGEYRTQDHDGKSPALGGGLAVGYRLPISRNNRWKMEFSVGAGAYKLHHDKFRNCPNGQLVYTKRETYIGIDQASLSFSYTFDLKRKGGAR